MGNCLVTKLKESVNNPDLRKIGELRIGVVSSESPDYNNRRIRIASNPSQVISCLGGGSFVDGSGTPTSTVATVNTTITTLVFANGTFDVSVPNKYDLTYLEGRNDNVFFYINDFAYCNKLETVYTAGETTTKGDISALKNLESLVDFRVGQAIGVTGDISNFPAQMMYILVGYTSVYGNIKSLIKCSGILQISVNGDSDVIGTIEEFANGQVAAGRTSGDIRFDVAGSKVTYNNVVPESNNRHLYFGTSMEGQNPTAAETAQGWCWR